jgi:hypothetical protein
MSRHPLDTLRPSAQRLGREGLLALETERAVDEAVAVRWAEWQERHPRLARQLTRPDVVKLATAELLDDKAYREAMRRAALVFESATVLHRWATWAANRWLRL